MHNPKTHPTPTHKTCKDCGRILPLTAEHWYRRHGAHRYPWQISGWRERCKVCHGAYLRALKVAKREAVAEAHNARRREFRAVVRGSLGMGPDGVKDSRARAAAKAAEKLRKAEAKARVKRTAYRPYDPAKDPLKLKIKAESEAAMRKRLARSPLVKPATPSAPPRPPAPSRLLPEDMAQRLPFGVRREPG